MINTAYIGTRKLLFGTFAARRFCEHTGCSNEPSVILSQLLNPQTLQDALLYMVWSGLQAEAASKREPFLLDEYGVTELYDSATEAEGEQISYAFIGAVLNKSSDEVPAFLESLRQKAEADQQPDPNLPASNSPDWKQLEQWGYGYGLKPWEFWYDFGYGELLIWLSAQAKTRSDQEYAENFRCRRLATLVYNALAKSPDGAKVLAPTGDAPPVSGLYTLDSAESIRTFGEMMRATNLPVN